MELKNIDIVSDVGFTDSSHFAQHPQVTELYSRQSTPHTFNAAHRRLRKQHLTASVAGACIPKDTIRGGHKFMTRRKALKEYLEADKDSDERKVNIACEHGHKYEAELGLAYFAATGNKLVDKPIGMLVSEEHKWIAATPDFVVSHAPILVEGKCPFRAKIEHKVPDHHYTQLQMQLHVTGFDTLHYVQYRPENPHERGMLDIIVVKKDNEWWKKAMVFFTEFWDEVLNKRAELKLVIPEAACRDEVINVLFYFSCRCPFPDIRPAVHRRSAKFPFFRSPSSSNRRPMRF